MGWYAMHDARERENINGFHASGAALGADHYNLLSVTNMDPPEVLGATQVQP
jgi:hypothetical protein